MLAFTSWVWWLRTKIETACYCRINLSTFCSDIQDVYLRYQRLKGAFVVRNTSDVFAASNQIPAGSSAAPISADDAAVASTVHAEQQVQDRHLQMIEGLYKELQHSRSREEKALEELVELDSAARQAEVRATRSEERALELSAQLQQAVLMLKRKAQKLGRFRRERDSLLVAMTREQSIVDRLTEEMAAARDAELVAQQSVLAITHDKDKLSAQSEHVLRERDAAIAGLRQEISSLKASLAEEKSRSADLLRRNGELQSSVRERESEIRGRDTMIADMKHSASKASDEQARQKAELEASVQRLKESIAHSTSGTKALADQSEMERRAMNSQIAQLSQTLATAGEERQALHKLTEQRRKEIEHLKDTLSQARDKLQSMETAASRKEEAVVSLTSKLQHEQEHNRLLQTKLADVERVSAQREGALKELNSRFDASNKLLQVEKAERLKADDQVAQLSREVASLKKELSQVRGRTQKEGSLHQQQVDKLTAQLSERADRLQLAEEQVSALTVEREQLRGQVAALQTAVQHEQVTARSAESSMQELRSEITRLSSEVTLARSAHDDAVRETQSTRQLLQDVEASHAMHSNQASETAAETNRLRSALNDVTVELTAIRLRLEQRDHEFAVLKSDAEDARSKLAQSHNANESATKALVDAEAKLQRALADADRVRAELTVQLQATAKDLQLAQSELESVSKSERRLTGEVASLMAQLSTVQTQYSAQQIELQSLKHSAESSEHTAVSDLRRAQEEIATLRQAAAGALSQAEAARTVLERLQGVHHEALEQQRLTEQELRRAVLGQQLAAEQLEEAKCKHSDQEAEMKSELDVACGRIAETQLQLEQLAAELESRKQELSAKSHRSDLLSHELSTAQKLSSEASVQIARLEGLLKDSVSQVEAYKTDLERSRARNTELEAHVQRATAQLADVEKRSETSAETVSGSQARVDALQRERDEVGARRVSCRTDCSSDALM